MKLETQRILLRDINESHVDDILRIRSNEVVNRFVIRKSPENNYDALQFILTIKEKTKNNLNYHRFRSEYTKIIINLNHPYLNLVGRLSFQM